MMTHTSHTSCSTRHLRRPGLLLSSHRHARAPSRPACFSRQLHPRPNFRIPLQGQAVLKDYMSSFRSYADDPAPEEVQEADPRREEQDYGNVVAFEHINLEVPDLEVARLFYSEVLGLTPDPSRTGQQRGTAQVCWYNIGRQQLHIAKGPVAQLLPPGSTIGLVLPSVEPIVKAANDLKSVLGELPVLPIAPGVIQLNDPNGVTYTVHEQYKGFHAERGIAYIHLPCFVGSSPLIARFYGQTLGARVKLHGQPVTLSASSGAVSTSCIIRTDSDHLLETDALVQTGAGMVPKHPTPLTSPRPHRPHRGMPDLSHVRSCPRAVVQMGVPCTHLVFYEEPGLGPWSTQAALSLYSGWHMAFYISQFSHCYVRLRTLIFNSHPYRDKVHRFGDALDYHQFRFQDVVLLPDPFAPDTPMLESVIASGQVVSVSPPGDLTARSASPAPDQPMANGAASAAGAATGDGQEESRAALVSRGVGPLAPVASVVPFMGDQVTEEGVPCQPGQLLYRISHEVRSLAHPMFLRPLYNRSRGLE